LILDYPHPRERRRHGPSGYTSFRRYRPWLRDEFRFRCVYCLKRETWGQLTGEFDLDHFEPESVNLQRRLDYFNLVYACRRCNLVKLDQAVGNPFELLHSDNVATWPDGSLQARDDATRRLIRQLDLNSPRLRSWRIMWMRIADLAEEYDVDLYHRVVGFPHDLPDLSRLRPPQNNRPEGIEESCFAQRQRGALPAVY
jgi:5-methylcytosine-specific restriction endonuclease McrA